MNYFLIATNCLQLGTIITLVLLLIKNTKKNYEKNIDLITNSYEKIENKIIEYKNSNEMKELKKLLIETGKFEGYKQLLDSIRVEFSDPITEEKDEFWFKKTIRVYSNQTIYLGNIPLGNTCRVLISENIKIDHKKVGEVIDSATKAICALVAAYIKSKEQIEKDKDPDKTTIDSKIKNLTTAST